jgi:hypothetical protein
MAWLDEDDLTPTDHGAGSQIPAVHEFGHLLGLGHPGKRDAPDEYTKDAPSLMGLGMELRPSYFQKWCDWLNAEDPKFAPYSVIDLAAIFKKE